MFKDGQSHRRSHLHITIPHSQQRIPTGRNFPLSFLGIETIGLDIVCVRIRKLNKRCHGDRPTTDIPAGLSALHPRPVAAPRLVLGLGAVIHLLLKRISAAGAGGSTWDDSRPSLTQFVRETGKLGSPSWPYWFILSPGFQFRCVHKNLCR